jgi:hypothetical protein
MPKLYSWSSLLLLILVLAACRPPAARNNGGVTVTPTANADMTANADISFTARPSEVASGSSTVLAVQVTEGSVSTVDVALKGSRPFVINIALSENGNYSFTSPVVTQDTTFVVTGKDASGNVVATSETIVLVNPAAQGVTPEVPVTPEATPTTTPEGSATPPTTPATPATPEVAATPEAPVTPEAPATPATSQEGVAEGAVRVGTLAELQAATAEDSTATTIIVAGTITCDADPCVRLKAGQTLMGEAGAVLLGDRSNDGDLTTLVELAPDVSVVGLELTGPDIYTAINAVDAELSGTVLIKDVTITSPTSNAPITVRDSDAAGDYTLLIEGLTVAETVKAISFADFTNLELKGSTINLNVSDNPRGLIFQTNGSGSVLVDNLAVSSTLAAETFTPVNFVNVGTGALEVTLSNSVLVFPTATPETLAVARSFGLESSNGGTMTITEASTGNTTQALSPLTVIYDVRGATEPTTVITGSVQGTLGDGTAFAVRE